MEDAAARPAIDGSVFGFQAARGQRIQFPYQITIRTCGSKAPMKMFLGRLNAEMKLAIACLLVLVALAPAAFSAAAVPGPEYVLENASTRLVVKDSRVVSLLDKVRSLEHVSPQATSATGMFRIQLVKGSHRQESHLDRIYRIARMLKLSAARKHLAEPAFGQIKRIRGFRKFLLRGLESVSTEWQIASKC